MNKQIRLGLYRSKPIKAKELRRMDEYTLHAQLIAWHYD